MFSRLPWADQTPLIGLGHKKGSGKDTVADLLVQRHGYLKLSFAYPLKESAMNLCEFTREQVYGQSKEDIDSYWGFSPRWFMQRFGTEVGRAIDPDFWVKLMDRSLRRGSKARGIVIADMRFPNEANAIKDWGGVIVRVDRLRTIPSFRSSVTSWLKKTGAHHPSETALNRFKFDLVLDNTGSLWDLENQVDYLAEVVRQVRRE